MISRCTLPVGGWLLQHNLPTTSIASTTTQPHKYQRRCIHQLLHTYRKPLITSAIDRMHQLHVSLIYTSPHQPLLTSPPTPQSKRYLRTERRLYHAATIEIPVHASQSPAIRHGAGTLPTNIRTAQCCNAPTSPHVLHSAPIATPQQPINPQLHSRHSWRARCSSSKTPLVTLSTTKPTLCHQPCING